MDTVNDSRGAALGRTSLLDLLRTCIRRKADGVDDLEDAKPIEAADDEYDPMNDIGSASATNMLCQATYEAGHVITRTVLRIALSR